MAVITVSRELGSLGDELARVVAARLGYDLVDKLKMSEALEMQGFHPSEVEKFDERKPSIWQSLSHQRNRFLYSIRAAVYEFAAGQNAVIVGRGGQVLLRDLPGALHVRVTCPVKTRVKRLMEQHGYEQRQAERVVRQADRESAGFIGSFFDADWDDSALYDLTINTRTMSLETAIDLVISAVGAPEFKVTSGEAAEKLKDLALRQKVESTLLGFPGVDVSVIKIENGVVSLTGMARSSEMIAECEKALRGLEGVKDLVSHIEVMEITLG
ncbi:MAG: cytidylate kinase family protein [Desulfobacterales bacterium]